MPAQFLRAAKRALEPTERISEVLFGLIMVLTFTGSLSVSQAGRDDVRTMLIGALGCNIAWGIIDALFYLMGCLAEKASNIKTLHSIRLAEDPRKADKIIADSLPRLVAGVIEPAELETLRTRLKALPEPPERASLSKKDWLGSLGIFLLVFLSTFPVAIPFLFMKSTLHAMRASNAVAIVMLFIAGVAYGRCVGRPSWIVGLAMVVLGAILVALTLALGG